MSPYHFNTGWPASMRRSTSQCTTSLMVTHTHAVPTTTPCYSNILIYISSVHIPLLRTGCRIISHFILSLSLSDNNTSLIHVQNKNHLKGLLSFVVNGFTVIVLMLMVIVVLVIISWSLFCDECRRETGAPGLPHPTVLLQCPAAAPLPGE